ncbi:MAG: hypothetical protein RR949_04040, partial [Oscillospiraceae bacterium]
RLNTFFSFDKKISYIYPDFCVRIEVRRVVLTDGKPVVTTPRFFVWLAQNIERQRIEGGYTNVST